MRILSSFFAFIAFGLSAIAADRQIGYVQQEKPGELVMASVIQSGKKHVIVIHDFRKGAGEKARPLTKEDFESLWSVFTGSEAAEYAFEASSATNMSDVGFYTVKIVGAKKPLSLRIPKEQKSEAISGALARIKAWIDEKG